MTETETEAEVTQQLTDFVLLANQLIFEFYESRASCIFSTGVICDVLNARGIQAEPLRVTCATFPMPNGPGGVLGSDGCGQRMAAASPGCWHGHLVTLVNGIYLLDSTVDQINDKHSLGAFPVAIHLPDTEWFNPPAHNPQYHWTGLLRLFPDSVTRYSQYHRQNGWQHAADWTRKKMRKACAQILLDTWHF